jgi:hypothetical protein
MNKENKKIIASFELMLMVVSVFAFSYMMYNSVGVFAEVDKAYEAARAERAEQIAEMDIPERAPKQSFLMKIIGYFKKPIIPAVSAQTTETIVGYDPLGNPIYLSEETTSTTFDISSTSERIGCCAQTKGGEKCATKEPEYCDENSLFAEGALCTQTSFCQKGCCFDEASGTYDKNVLEGDCSVEWNADPNCNMPGAKLGCCVLGTTSTYETQGQCETDTLGSVLGPEAVVDWRGDLGEGGCLILSATQKEGACVIGGGNCKFVTEIDCLGYNGQFNEGYLCTSESLDTSCEMTDKTTCVDGKDGVYFLDSCGNFANIYDSSKLTDINYWDQVVSGEEICGDSNVDTGNANSKSCGNCNRFAGGLCGSAVEDNFHVNAGDNYCRDTSCLFDGENYKNGESWCVYDGAIGDGDDVVGSRHWKYVCSQGVTQIEPCADYRNQICTQTNTFDVNGTNVEFRNSACIANNWRACIDLNSKEDGMETCEETLNCRVEKVDIADKFKFDVCLPRYPGGFSLKDERYMKTAEGLCGSADQTCTVVKKPKTFGGCEIIANKNCLTEEFAKGMNDFCTGLGDCGGAVNIEGEYSENYDVENSAMLGTDAISRLIGMAKPIKGQFAETEDYSEFLKAAGLWGGPGPAPEGEEADPMFDIDPQQVGMGAAGIPLAVGTGVILLTEATGFTYSAFANGAIGFGIGMVVGSIIAKQLGLSPGGSLLMAVGGGLIGLAFVLEGMAFIGMCFEMITCTIGVILIVTSLFFGGDDCDPIEVKFECKPWKPPKGGDDCEKCNEDPLKPCSEYRCNSLGAACELVNKGGENEMCSSSEDDGKAPILNPDLNVISGTEKYDDITSEGFSLTSSSGGCIDAYTPLQFGIVTNELAYCRFDVEAKEFDELSYDLGGNSYLYNHTTVFTLPDPSHGQSQGGDWTGDLNFYIKCQDTHGHESQGFYEVYMCVKEGPDKTGPLIRTLDPQNDAIVGFETSSTNVSVVTNELATCRWDSEDKDYSAMINEMECNDNLNSASTPMGYLCTDVMFTTNTENLVYIRCMDQPWLEDEGERNPNEESTQYLLRKPEKKIEIDWIEPSEDFETNTEFTSIDLTVQTSGGGEFHWCSYSFSGFETMIKFFETGDETLHVQPLRRPAGTDKIYVQCEDETGDFVQSTTEFRIIYDTSTPQIARVWQIGTSLHIITTEPAECVYSTDYCNFKWINGTSMTGSEEFTIGVIPGKKYHIKCKDEFGNAPSGCSISVNAV